jgi:hypothetical protein
MRGVRGPDLEFTGMENSTRNVSHYNVAYWALRPFWTDCLNLKEPLPTTLGHYLSRYPKEDDSEYVERLKRLAQVNFLDLIVEFYCSMLFSTSVQITAQKHQDEVNSFVSSCNQQGDSLLDYFQEIIAPSSFTYGVTDVFVDLPESVTPAKSALEQQSLGLTTPYCYIVPPLNRTSWDLDAARNYSFYQSFDVVNTQISAQMNVKDEKQYRQWTPETVTILDDKNETIGQVRPNPYGLIPAVTVMPLSSMRYYSDRLGLSLVKDVVPLQKLVLNLMSLILDFHESVNFGQRVIVQDTKNGDEPPEEGELKELGNKRGLILRGEGSKFEVVTPDAAGVESMRAYLGELIDRIYQSQLIPSDSNLNKTHQSANTIRGNLSQLYNRLTKISKHFAKALKQIVEMALRVQGIDPAEAEISVQWDTNFSYESLMNSIQQLTALRQAVGDISPVAIKEYAKRVVSPALYSSGKMDAINQEIDAYDGPTGQQQAKPQPDLLREQNESMRAGEVAQEQSPENSGE